MPKFKLVELGPELASIYQEYLNITDELRAIQENEETDQAEISAIEALSRVEKLKIEDFFGGVWSIDPETGTFILNDSNGVQTFPADPKQFQPKRDYDNSELEDIKKVDYHKDKPKDTVDFYAGSYGKKMSNTKKALYGVGALITAGALFIGGFGLAMSNQPEVEEEVAEDPRPTLEDAQPTAERVNQVLRTLEVGDRNQVTGVVENTADDAELRWALSVFPSVSASGHTLRHIVTEDDVAVLQVIDGSNNVVMEGDLAWEQDYSGTWNLVELPLMNPVHDDVEPTEESEEGAGEEPVDATEDPDETSDPDESADEEEGEEDEEEPEETEG